MIEMVANQIEYLCTGQNQCSVVSFPSVLVITLKSRSNRNKDKELFKMWVASGLKVNGSNFTAFSEYG